MEIPGAGAVRRFRIGRPTTARDIKGWTGAPIRLTGIPAIGINHEETPMDVEKGQVSCARGRLGMTPAPSYRVGRSC
jgi:hypothetical protein